MAEKVREGPKFLLSQKLLVFDFKGIFRPPEIANKSKNGSKYEQTPKGDNHEKAPFASSGSYISPGLIWWVQDGESSPYCNYRLV